MKAEKIINWFLPKPVRNNKEHPRYHELYTVAGSIVVGVTATCVFPVLLIWYDIGEYLWMFYLNAAINLTTLFAIRYTGHYRSFNLFSALVTYFFIYYWLKDSGLIYSTNICIIHIFLLAGILADQKWGWLTIFTNIAYLGVIYYLTIESAGYAALEATLGSPVRALLMHGLITAFLGSYLAYTLKNTEISRKQIIGLRDQKINLLDEAVRQRTEQLNGMRQTIAADFHDQTGNMLAAINRQAAILQLRLRHNTEALPLVESIITNSNGLYASSKDFLWNLNNDSDNPVTLFGYLTAYGQNFYNQFDIGFSAKIVGDTDQLKQLDPFAALNMIYIFKEAMSNVVKHSGADEVNMQMQYKEQSIEYKLQDNGNWKTADPNVAHYGLQNIERRSEKSGFGFLLHKENSGTSIAITLPVHANALNG